MADNSERDAIVAWLDRRIAQMDRDLTKATAPYVGQAIAETRQTTVAIRTAIERGDHLATPTGQENKYG